MGKENATSYLLISTKCQGYNSDPWFFCRIYSSDTWFFCRIYKPL